MCACFSLRTVEKKGRGSWLLPSRNSQLVETSLAHLSQLELCTDRWDCGGGGRYQGYSVIQGFQSGYSLRENMVSVRTGQTLEGC